MTGPIRQAVDAHLGSRQVARVVYGSIIGLALLVVLENHPPSTGVVIASMLATAISVALAELYSEIVGFETSMRRRVDWAQIAGMLDHVVAVAFGIAFPAVFFVLAALGAMEQDTAFAIAKWTGLGLIGIYAFCAARFAGARLPLALLQAVAVAGVGGFLIAIKAVLH